MEPGGQFDFQQILAAAAQVQSQLASAQEQLAETEVEGRAGGGLVTATLSGDGELVDLVIESAALQGADPDDIAQTVADLVLAACRDAYRALEHVRDKMVSPLDSVLGGGLGGIPGLGDIPGLPQTPGLSQQAADDDADDGEPGDGPASGGDPGGVSGS